MLFSSTAKKVKGVGLHRALLEGFAPDGGLYLPDALPKLPFSNWRGLEFAEISLEIAALLFGETLSRGVLEQVVERAFDFALPRISFGHNVHVLELFHGPTHSFKDIGARFMAQLFKALGLEATVLVATTGDTGSAVGAAFHRIPGVRVFILYPKGRVTPSQEKQLTTLGGNVTALEVDGTFEECQTLLKEALLDPTLSGITTGNSINVGRLLPQVFYYFYALLQLDEPTRVSVPCGNFGHLVSGILAARMGLPVKRFIAATNINDEVPLFLQTGLFTPHTSYPTAAPSMDVGNPSNFPRLLELYNHDRAWMQREIEGVRFSDEEIYTGIEQMYAREGYILDPHSAVAYLGLKGEGLFMATAHPAKFLETVQPHIPEKIAVPEELRKTYLKEKQALPLSAHYEELVSMLKK